MTPASPYSRRAARVLAVVLVGGVMAVVAACGSSGGDATNTTASSAAAPATSAAPSPTDGGTEPAPSTTPSTVAGGVTIEVTEKDGKVQGGVVRHKVKLGENVTIRVTADADEEIHLHGYDLKQDIKSGQPGTISFVADIPGVFEAELEHSGLKLLELEVA